MAGCVGPVVPKKMETLVDLSGLLSLQLIGVQNVRHPIRPCSLDRLRPQEAVSRGFDPRRKTNSALLDIVNDDWQVLDGEFPFDTWILVNKLLGMMSLATSNIHPGVLRAFTGIKTIEAYSLKGKPVRPVQPMRRPKDAVHEDVEVLHDAGLLRPVPESVVICIVREVEGAIREAFRKLVAI